MFNLRAKLVVFAAATTLNILSFGANADVIFPALDIATLAGDTGVSSDGTTLTVDATAFSIVTDSGFIEIPDVDFSLTASYNSFDGGITYTFINGSLTAGTLLSATFDTMDILTLGGGIGNFLADVTYTGGSLAGGLTSGRIEGQFTNASSGDFSGAFTADSVIAKVGPVVPVPAAVWLFGSGLIGLIGIARRKKS